MGAAADGLTLLRGAVARRDLAVLDTPAGLAAAAIAPQHAGQLLLVAGVPTSPLADGIRQRLEERAWPGDVELVEQLAGRLLPAAHVQLDELTAALDSRDGGLLDPRTGETRTHEVLDLLEEDDALTIDRDDVVLVAVPGRGASDAWRDRRLFADGVADERARRALQSALDGPGAFRRFSRALDRWPDLVPGFLTLRDERALGRARQWLASTGHLQAGA